MEPNQMFLLERICARRQNLMTLPKGAMQKIFLIPWRIVGQNWQEGDIFLRKRGSLTYQLLGGLNHP